jgi:hypothetical protein
MHRTADQLTAALDGIARSPRDRGTVELLVTRPADGERAVTTEVTLDAKLGVVGDNWSVRPSKRTPDGSPSLPRQVTLMNIRAVRAIADEDRWPLAGDQLYVDLNLGYENLPPGTRLRIGTALVEVSVEPHTGCAKFTERFGSEATRWLNTETGRALNLRGINARVIEGGVVRKGDVVSVERR